MNIFKNKRRHVGLCVLSISAAGMFISLRGESGSEDGSTASTTPTSATAGVFVNHSGISLTYTKDSITDILSAAAAWQVTEDAYGYLTYETSFYKVKKVSILHRFEDQDGYTSSEPDYENYQRLRIIEENSSGTTGKTINIRNYMVDPDAGDDQDIERLLAKCQEVAEIAMIDPDRFKFTISVYGSSLRMWTANSDMDLYAVFDDLNSNTTSGAADMGSYRMHVDCGVEAK